ncbi:hypothetical protein CJF42_24440 [Pseudoalteromonas sp. NBT06-2]|uniref:hypothetical protein n=1 Tax=Pseudoalteromonas sp. NBT06-2 TaxID=2025950 RepID=UPI000BA59417|nr:hypothetical protein [Pseudoalteromonas sp. NBT06-2]PAJ71853.1 hypothetical protein CJF42_24440 [Pseudoalteromonas sp. NBT06-2]
MYKLEVEVNRTDETIKFDMFLDEVAQANFNESSEVLHIANLMHKLSNNEEELINILMLYACQGNDIENAYAENSLICAVFEHCSIRLNFWHPSENILDLPHIESELHIYDMPHDHNFDFLTVGMWGEGYSTEVYSYDRNQVKGYIGEEVNADYHGIKTLGRGDVHFYRKSHHIHSQIAPNELSISLNVLIDPEMTEEMDEQFRFKKHNQKSLIIDRTEMAATNGLLGMAQPFINMLQEFGGSDIDSILSGLTKSKNHYVRLDAYKILYSRSNPLAKQKLLKSAELDSSELIKSAFHKEVV